MTRGSKKFATIVAAVLLGVGLLVGFIPTSSAGVNCGSAFVGSDDPATADITGAVRADFYGDDMDGVGAVTAACDDRRSLLRIPALALLVVGGGGLIAARSVREVEHA